MKNKLVNLLAIIIIGGLSGILGVQIFLPWLAGFAFFAKFDWIRQSREGTTVINSTERVVVTENQALEEAIEKASRIVVGVTAQRTEKVVGGPLRQSGSEASKKTALPKPEILAQGTGFIVSGDGLIVTAENLVPQTAQKIMVSLGGRNIDAEIKKRDKNSGLVLLKINENNLPVLPFTETEPKLGERVFLVALTGEKKSLLTDLSLIKQILPFLLTDFDDKNINGSPIFNIKAEIIGVNFINAKEQNEIAGVLRVRDLLK